ncbi:GNAT family N-acetyltransferase [Virgibacillus flavescens]|uniref:GNAT family N-acetyltransferase n=1 Tax=Virgibacillus flavescens TaxID=1611422 RepID=UPI003D325942
MIDAKKIKPELTYDLRHRILRPHRPIEECMYDTDHEAGTFHIGAFSNGQLISVASFCNETNPNLSAQKQYRLRAMATLEEYRMFGAGRSLVNYSEKLLNELAVDLLWCKARTAVQKYYSRLGFSAQGEVFDYPTLGPHIIMFKKIN